MPAKGQTTSIESRYWPKVKKTRKCWLWIGGKRNYKGYGTIHRPGRGTGSISTHRFAWELVHGSIPDGMQVLHKCDNTSCVNPKHLFLGINDDNMKDRYRKGRYNTQPKGEDHHGAKLKREDIQKIKKLYNDGWLHREIAEHFGVVKGTIGFILRGETWK